MKTDTLDYHLPEELIALQPAEKRSASRMMVLDRNNDLIDHEGFIKLPDRLNPGDLLVLNDTRVLPARIFGRRKTGGKVEFLLTEHERETPTDRSGKTTWQAMVRCSKQLAVGEEVLLDGYALCRIKANLEDGFYRVLFPETIKEHLEKFGQMPLPPYIESRRPVEESDKQRYQTIYAEKDGSCAAPTAGLHFTEELLTSLTEKGVEIARLTLHVGPGTFLPLRTDTVEEHRMHSEYYQIPEQTLDQLGKAKEEGRRIVACGTTTVRALEAYGQSGETSGKTDLFIRPGFEFRLTDALLTNFHLPKSTLLLLVGAFYGLERILDAYQEAVKLGYRFYSYGDCMMIV